MQGQAFIHGTSHLLILLFTATGCTTRTISVRSEPPGATVSVAGESSTTPCRMRIPKQAKLIHLSLEGYQPEELALRQPPRTPRRFVHGLGLATVRSSKVTGGLLAGAGILGLLAWAADEDDDEFDDGDEGLGWTFMGLSAAALAVGGLMYTFSEDAEYSLEGTGPASEYFVELKPEEK